MNESLPIRDLRGHPSEAPQDNQLPNLHFSILLNCKRTLSPLKELIRMVGTLCREIELLQLCCDDRMGI
jgi:hypothetical protein